MVLAHLNSSGISVYLAQIASWFVPEAKHVQKPFDRVSIYKLSGPLHPSHILEGEF